MRVRWNLRGLQDIVGAFLQVRGVVRGKQDGDAAFLQHEEYVTQFVAVKKDQGRWWVRPGISTSARWDRAMARLHLTFMPSESIRGGFALIQREEGEVLPVGAFVPVGVEHSWSRMRGL